MFFICIIAKMETYYQKYRELSSFLVNLDLVDRVFEQEETRQLLKIFKRRTSVDYDSSRIKLIKQTETESEYDIHFYYKGVKIKEQKLMDLSTLDKKTYIDEFIATHYPEIKKIPVLKKPRKVKKKTPFDPAEYVIHFGKYSGRKISTLTEPEELQYCEWAVKQFKKNARTTNKLKAFEWHLTEMKKGA